MKSAATVLVALALGVILLAMTIDAHSSVKTVKPPTFEEKLDHNHIHRQHRRADGVPHGDKLPRPLEHHEVAQADHEERYAEDGGHRYFSPNLRHRVGPQFDASQRISHKPPRRHDPKGNPIPHEINDETLRRMRHHQ